MTAGHGMRVLALSVLVVILSLPTTLQARTQGDFLFQFGWLHARPQIGNDAPSNRLRSNPLFAPLGIEERFRSPGVALRGPNSDTLGLILKYFATDHWALKLQAGIPPKSGVRGEGVVRPTGPTGAVARVDLGDPSYQPLGRARQWSPVVMLEYHFLSPEAVLRPHLGLGATFTWFTEESLNDELDAAINRRFGAPLAAAAGRPGPTHTQADTADTWALAFEAGATVALGDRWSATLSAAYIPLETTGTVRLNADDGTRLAGSRTRIALDPVILGLLVGYRF